MKPRVTGLDVARLAGVSKSAVSRVFTRGVVSEDVRTRVLEAAKQLKYRPSNTARSLTTSQSKMIGLAITQLDNQFYPDVVQRLSDRFATEGYRLLLFVTHGDTDLDPVLDELLGYGLDAVILASSSLTAEIATECMSASVPVLMFNSVDPGGVVPGISCDDKAGAEIVADHLLGLGHTRFGIVTGLRQSSSSVQRTRAFRNRILAAGFDAPLERSGAYTFDGAFEAVSSMLAESEPPDALFCINDHMAFAALQAIQESGRTPGVDISVVGFDNVGISNWPAFSLTTLEQPLQEMVEATVGALLDAISGRKVKLNSSSFQGRLVVRGSTRQV
ncbi:LacI family DNA-binding transcriptional regulator [Novosphingobium profundi]|uniref:LacI family DNA-binding transcriptional regulator n=1 Tax=Novosphingobium profundi TaxID=1774954 RepID=UPI001BDA0571|nr:LacI family DNA-binding transcriptional regulator [Novosphingobium profundi]MBT0670653.1 LacI family DNA-binding transcriptional regulator [Novosphingobium profundi]